VGSFAQLAMSCVRQAVGCGQEAARRLKELTLKDRGGYSERSRTCRVNKASEGSKRCCGCERLVGRGRVRYEKSHCAETYASQQASSDGKICSRSMDCSAAVNDNQAARQGNHDLDRDVLTAANGHSRGVGQAAKLCTCKPTLDPTARCSCACANRCAAAVSVGFLHMCTDQLCATN